MNRSNKINDDQYAKRTEPGDLAKWLLQLHKLSSKTECTTFLKIYLFCTRRVSHEGLGKSSSLHYLHGVILNLLIEAGVSKNVQEVREYRSLTQMCKFCNVFGAQGIANYLSRLIYVHQMLCQPNRGENINVSCSYCVVGTAWERRHEQSPAHRATNLQAAKTLQNENF